MDFKKSCIQNLLGRIKISQNNGTSEAKDDIWVYLCIKMMMLDKCEYHKVNSVYGRIDRHLVGLQNRSAGVCLFKSSSQPAWEGSPELQDLPRTDLISLQVLLSLSLFNIQSHPQPLSPYFILPIWHFLLSHLLSFSPQPVR